MARQPDQPASFDARYGALSKEVFQNIVREELAKGANADEQARVYAELGKPDFALAYLLAGTLADAEKHDLLARAYERRAEQTEARAREFDKRFHRPFPLLFTDATRDRTAASRIRAGRALQPDMNRPAPLV